MSGKYTSLFGILNYCLTKIGARTLRSSILQPSSSVREIETRLDCVEELIKNPEILNLLKVKKLNSVYIFHVNSQYNFTVASFTFFYKKPKRNSLPC